MKGETLFLPTSSSSPPPSPQKKLPPFYPVVHPNTRVVTMTQPAVGHLVPLDKQQREDTSIPRITLLEGRNCIARKTTAALNDRRLSRDKHLSLTASSADASASLVVEGMNPIVVYSGKTRLSLKSKETSKLGHGDVVELVPGHFRYKFEVLSGGDENGNVGVFDNRKRGSNSNDGGKAVEVEELGRKRPRQANSKAEVEGSSFETDPEEGIRHFGVPNDNLAQTFQFLNVQGLPQSATTSCVSIQDVIQGDILVAILSNYMVDLDWLIPACPLIAKVPHVLVIHGEGGRTLNYMKRKKPAKWILHKPPLPISFGTHHSKAMLLVYPRGVRIIVHTANLIHVDWNNKSQGLWMQDFPWKDQNNPSKGCGFENDLIDYLSTLKWPEFSVNLPDLGSFNINPSFFKKFDYSNAAVKLDLIQKELWEKTNLEIVEMRKESKRRR